MSVDYVMIWPKRFGGFDRQFKNVKRLYDVAAVGRHAKRRVRALTFPGFPKNLRKRAVSGFRVQLSSIASKRLQSRVYSVHV